MIVRKEDSGKRILRDELKRLKNLLQEVVASNLFLYVDKDQSRQDLEHLENRPWGKGYVGRKTTKIGFPWPSKLFQKQRMFVLHFAAIILKCSSHNPANFHIHDSPISITSCCFSAVIIYNNCSALSAYSVAYLHSVLLSINAIYNSPCLIIH